MSQQGEERVATLPGRDTANTRGPTQVSRQPEISKIEIHFGKGPISFNFHLPSIMQSFFL